MTDSPSAQFFTLENAKKNLGGRIL